MKGRLLDSIAQIDNEKVIAGSHTVKQAVDLVTPEMWTSPNVRILDPACKGGEFLHECALRLWEGLTEAIPDEDERRRVILHECLHGVAIDRICALITRRTLYCSADASAPLCIEPFDNAAGNIRFHLPNMDSKGAKHLGPYPFLHNGAPDMNFDLVIGNPPYQLNTGGGQAQARPIYPAFWRKAVEQNPTEIVMVMPSRWFASDGFGLGKFRAEVLSSGNVAELHDFPDSQELFPDNDIKGGVCFMKFRRDHQGDTLIKSTANGHDVSESVRPLDCGQGIILRKELDVGLAGRVLEHQEPAMNDVVSSLCPFGLPTDQVPNEDGDLTLVSKKGSGKWNRADLKKGHDLVDRWKVGIAKAGNTEYDSSGSRSIFSDIHVWPPGTICTMTWLVIPADSEEDAKRIRRYLGTKFARYLIGMADTSINFTPRRFRLTPSIGAERDWTDELLYERYDLTEAERNEIERTIKPRAQA